MIQLQVHGLKPGAVVSIRAGYPSLLYSLVDKSEPVHKMQPKENLYGMLLQKGEFPGNQQL